MNPVAPAREPAINAPWTLIALAGTLILAHLARLATGTDMGRFGLSFIDLVEGRYWGVVTYVFVHGGWAHLLVNTAWIVAFGAPVARFLGARPRGGLAFFGFFLACGAGSALAYAGLQDILARLGHPSGLWTLIGASGAASGLMAAAARLIDGKGRLGPLTGPMTVRFTLGWIAVNVVMGPLGFSPGGGGGPVAWEAHIFGFFCGLALISPAAWLAGVKGDHVIAL